MVDKSVGISISKFIEKLYK